MSQNTWGWSNAQCAHAHELLGADLDDRNAGVVVKMGNDRVRHGLMIRVLAVPGRSGGTLAARAAES